MRIIKNAIGILACLFLFSLQASSQTVYVTQTGNRYHTNKCKLYTKNFEAIPLWKAKGPYGKTPCQKCNPPTKETSSSSQKKPAQKPKKATGKK